MYGPELRTCVFGAVVSVLLGAGGGLGWHYFTDSVGGRAAAAATTPLIQQDVPQPSSSNPLAPTAGPILEAPQFPGLSRYPQPVAYNGPPMTVDKAAGGNPRQKLRKAGSQREARSKSSDS
jgi:hypothetical protein